MPATTTSCPTVVMDAPVETVWSLLTDPAGWSSFYDVRVMRVEPPGRAAVGQRVYAESGPRWLHLAVTLTYTAIDAARRRLDLEVRLPLGLTVSEVVSCSPVNEGQCRVDYHCHFRLPGGWRGALVRMFLGREMRDGPADSLGRLKEAAERRFAARDSSSAAKIGPRST